MRSDESEGIEAEDQELIDALKQLAAEEPSVDLLTQVMARAADDRRTSSVSGQVKTEERPSLRVVSHRRQGSLRPLLTSKWVGVLAACLLLSLAGNIWLGLQAFEPGELIRGRYGAQDDYHAVRKLLASLKAQDGASMFHSSLFQSSIKTDKNLGTLVTANPSLEKPTRTLGFASSSAFYAIGVWYAEASASVQGGKLDIAAQRPDSIDRELRRFPLPSSLTTYLRTMRLALEHRQYSRVVFGEGLALFQPLCEEYARHQGPEALTLFRAGAWLVNMRLTAVAGDATLLRQGDNVQYFVREMARVHAPQEVLDILEKLGHIVAKHTISDRDVQDVLTLVTKMQRRLG